ncbi:MAG: glycosyltransferase [Flavobacteriales bacterium]
MKHSAKKKILHITNWYPNQEAEKEALWIREHIASLEPFFENEVVHVELKPGKAFKRRKSLDEGVRSYSFEVPIRSWFLIELFSTLLLIYVLFAKSELKRVDLIDFHVAYPLCTHLHRFKKLLGRPVVITEHWSAYHFGFHTTKEWGLRRIRNIFLKNDVGLITVSDALRKDIENFVGRKLRYYIVPNIIPFEDAYFPGRSLGEEGQYRFFMVGNWKPPKRPLLALQAFCEVFWRDPSAQLMIGGYGSQVEEVVAFVKKRERDADITFLGEMDRNAILGALQNADAFMLPSDHETFSVVCAEALSEGVPVIASKRGGIPEFVNEGNGILVETNDPKNWSEALREFVRRKENGHFDPRRISEDARKRFGKDRVGELYRSVLEQEMAKFHRT